MRKKKTEKVTIKSKRKENRGMRIYYFNLRIYYFKNANLLFQKCGSIVTRIFLEEPLHACVRGVCILIQAFWQAAEIQPSRFLRDSFEVSCQVLSKFLVLRAAKCRLVLRVATLACQCLPSAQGLQVPSRSLQGSGPSKMPSSPQTSIFDPSKALQVLSKTFQVPLLACLFVLFVWLFFQPGFYPCCIARALTF